MHDINLLVYGSNVQLENSFKKEIMDVFKRDEFYGEIINELQSKKRK